MSHGIYHLTQEESDLILDRWKLIASELKYYTGILYCPLWTNTYDTWVLRFVLTALHIV